METTESFSCQSIDGGDDMPASPQFSRVLEQMGDVEGNIRSRMKKIATTMYTSMPSIRVTCFDDEPYNEKMLSELENAPAKKTKETVAKANEAPVIGNSATKLNNKSDVVYSRNSSNGEETCKSKATTSGEENSAVINSSDGVLPKNNTARKCSKGFVVSSQTPNRTKTENNSTETKGQAFSPDVVKNPEAKAARKPSFNSSDSGLNSNILSSPSVRTRRYTICSLSSGNDSSNEPQNCQNNTGENNRKTSDGTMQNAPRSPRLGNRKFSSEILNGRKKPERIDLSFKVDSPANGSQNNLFRKRTPDTDKGIRHKRRQTSPASIKHASLVSDVGVASNIDNRNPDCRENQSLSQDASMDVTQRLNLASPPRTRRISTPRPPRADKPSHLGVSANHTQSKSETDLRKIVAEEEALEAQKRVSLSTPLRVRRGSESKGGEMKTSLGVSGKLSLSKSETDLRKLVSEEERAEARSRSLTSPMRTRKLSSSKPLATSEMIGSASSPVSPQVERKIYLAAAKPAARLPIRAKTRSDLQASSQSIIDQAEKELDRFSEQLPHISMEQVMKSWQTDSRHWNVVSSLVNPNSEPSKTNMDAVKNCRYIRDGVLRKKKTSY